MTNKKRKISLDIAQKLYNDYMILDDNKNLSEKLFKNTDSDILLNYTDLSIREIYNKLLIDNYPNESAIKAKFIDKVLLKSKSHISIFELNVNNSRADLCKINGSSNAFEIKTDLDSPFRLRKQLNDYLEVFEYVSIICSEDKYHIFCQYLTKNCGVYTYSINSFNYNFKLKRAPIKNSNYSSSKQLQVLNKQELIDSFKVPKTLKKEEMIEHISHKYSKKTINSTFKKNLKNRYTDKWNFFVQNHNDILEIDYQWFFKNNIPPEKIYHY
ncbi:sce7726 family protein [Listeria welshimeri]|uniref:sce7726 family protein n=1 Tax=Listeria welshimeri TaxID=1643 RepID=UPI001888CD0F|nr:sce7726 family protein [Listeria welshimeri]MBF2471906.1 sce7726 family protein [Listeria welshimeri]